MNKKTFVFLCVLSIAACLKISHLGDEPAGVPPANTPAPAADGTTPPPPPPSKEEQAAGKRFLKFLSKNPDIVEAMSSENPPTDKQLQKLMNFMVNDPFFQKQMLKDMVSKPGNEWMKDLSRNAQIRFVKIITSVPMSKLGDEKTMVQVIKKLYKDKEIGAVLKKKFGEIPPQGFAASLSATATAGFAAGVSHMKKSSI